MKPSCRVSTEGVVDLTMDCTPEDVIDLTVLESENESECDEHKAKRYFVGILHQ